MILRVITIVTAVSLLLACSSMRPDKVEPKEQEQQTRSVSIGWVNRDWRVCEEGKTCPKPTPKTIVLVAPRLPEFTSPTPPKNPITQQEPEPETPVVRQQPEPENQLVQPDITYLVTFQFAQASPTKEGAAQLIRILREIRENHVIHITGYTDDIGDKNYNDRLALRRARFVATWLKRHGIRNPMEVEAKGKCCYVATNETDDGRAANRRAEVVLRERQSNLDDNQEGDR